MGTLQFHFLIFMGKYDLFANPSSIETHTPQECSNNILDIASSELVFKHCYHNVKYSCSSQKKKEGRTLPKQPE